ncbi:RDD family protein [Roseomonas sp. 18066]|uniref:RDD family protein n=1 Tax=Roseomonas sp. 18066 TaxID=2681412 RepID=UPI00135C003E|nr:RDD family protein [Roseomonas sp. 18066]
MSAALNTPPRRDAGEPGRIRRFVTPEGVDLRLTLGEASERAGAFLIDLSIMVAILAAITILCWAMLAGNRFADLSLPAIIWLLSFFLLRCFYFTVFELRPSNATPGKRLMGLRVAARDGGRLGADAIFARNLVREVEIFLPITMFFAGNDPVSGWIAGAGLVWTGIFLFFPLFNRDRLRIGDLLAGTWVVKLPRRALLADLATAPAGSGPAFTTEQLRAYGVKELQVLETVLRQNREATVREVAERIRRKIDWQGESLADGEFLRAYYLALRRELEGKLLFGKRRKDKHDQ